MKTKMKKLAGALPVLLLAVSCVRAGNFDVSGLAVQSKNIQSIMNHAKTLNTQVKAEKRPQ